MILVVVDLGEFQGLLLQGVKLTSEELLLHLLVARVLPQELLVQHLHPVLVAQLLVGKVLHGQKFLFLVVIRLAEHLQLVEVESFGRPVLDLLDGQLSILQEVHQLLFSELWLAWVLHDLARLLADAPRQPGLVVADS